MGNIDLLDTIVITKLNKISTVGGDIFHGLKRDEKTFVDFGEAYFSYIDFNYIKAWKMHKHMTLNLVVPIGNVKFVFHEVNLNRFREEIIGIDNYSRITVPPNIWFGFQGLSSLNLILNIADMTHDPSEILRKDVMDICYEW